MKTAVLTALINLKQLSYKLVFAVYVVKFLLGKIPFPKNLYNTYAKRLVVALLVFSTFLSFHTPYVTMAQELTSSDNQSQEQVNTMPVVGPNSNDLKPVEAQSPDSAEPRPQIRVKQLEKETYTAEEAVVTTLENALPTQVSVEVIGPQGKVDNVNIVKTIEETGSTKIEVEPLNSFVPGKYTLKTTDTEGNTASQDFTWGVLALNSNKSVYTVGEQAHFAMAVLDEQGQMVCDASLKLEIKDPSGKTTTLSTEENTITANDSCEKKEIVQNPDFQGSFKDTSAVGNYLLKLEAVTKNGTYSIEDTFEVSEGVKFDVERNEPTRIYPPNTYPVDITIKATEDFTGTITETVPTSFKITPADGMLPFKSSEFVLKTQVEASANPSDSAVVTQPFTGTYPVSLGFGQTITDPEIAAKYATGKVLGNDGLDFQMPLGTSIIAADDGKVVRARENSDYGNTVVIEHAWGKTYYGYLSKINVSEGQEITRGQELGLSGVIGASYEGLHFGLKLNKNDRDNGYFGKVDPSSFLGLPTLEGEAVKVNTNGNSEVQILTWNLSFKKGETVKIGYSYLAPQVSPQFYTTGPLSFFDQNQTLIFAENRQWQIAADALPSPPVSFSGLVIYDEDGANTPTSPHYREWSGSDFSSEKQLAAYPEAVGTHGEIRHVQTAASPTANEIIYAANSAQGHLQVQVWKDGTWTSYGDFTTAMSTTRDERWFDVAYEGTTGQALIVYENSTTSDQTFAYRTWNGTAWSSEQTLNYSSFSGTETNGVITWVTLETKPNSSQDNIMLCFLGEATTTPDVLCARWNGTNDTWNEGTVITNAGVDGDSNTVTYDVAWEATSGAALVVYGTGTALNYRVYTFGSGFGTASSTGIAAPGAEVVWVKLAGRASSGDQIGMMWNDTISTTSADLGVDIWNGSDWTTLATPATSEDLDINNNGDGPPIGIAWTATDDKLLMTWRDGTTSETQLRWMVYDISAVAWTCPGNGQTVTSISAAQGSNGPCSGLGTWGSARVTNITLIPDPSSSNIMLLAMNSTAPFVVETQFWNPSIGWSSQTSNMGAIESDASDPNTPAPVSNPFRFVWKSYDTGTMYPKLTQDAYIWENDDGGDNTAQFGNSSIGTVVTFGAELWGAKYTLAKAATVKNIYAYLQWDGSGSSNVRAAIYADSSGTVGTLQGNSDIRTFTTTPQWVEFTFSTAVSLTAGDYWLSILGEDPGMYGYSQTGTTNQFFYQDSATWNSVTTPSPTAYENRNISIYATFSYQDDNSQQAAKNTAVTNVKKGERITLRDHIKNTGAALNSDLGLFYDQNDGVWSKVKNSASSVTSSGSCTNTNWDCETILGSGVSYTSVAINPATGLPWIAFYRNGGCNNSPTTVCTFNVAHYVGSGGTGCASTAWTCSIVEDPAGSESYGAYTSIAFDKNGKAWVSYWIYNSATQVAAFTVASYVGTGGSGCSIGASWNCEYIESASTSNSHGTHTSIAIDYNGTPWVAYFGDPNDSLRVATRGGGFGSTCADDADWTCDDVDDHSTNFLGQYTSIAFAPDNKPWISYYDSTNSQLKVASYVGSGGDCDLALGSDAWNCEAVDNTVTTTGQYTSIAFDSSGIPWVSYTDQSNLTLKVATRSNGTWNPTGTCTDTDWECAVVSADSSYGPGRHTSIAFAPDGKPWVSYQEEHSSGTSTRLNVARFVSSGGGSGCGSSGSSDWTCTIVDSSASSGSYTSIAFNPDGNAWVSYQGNGSSLSVAHIKRGGEITISSGLSSFNNASLNESHADMTTVSDTTGRDDADCVSGSTTWNVGRWFETENASNLSASLPNGNTTAQCTEVAWTLDTSQAQANTTYRFIIASKDAWNDGKGVWRGPIAVSSGAYPTLTIESGSPSKIYSKTNQIKLANCTDTTWGCTTVDNTGTNTGQFSSLDFDSSGNAWVSFVDTTSTSLKVAWYVGSAGNCTDTAWNCTTVDNTASIDQATSIKVGHNGKPWVAYYDGTTSDVKIAWYVGNGGNCTDTAWSCTTVDNSNGGSDITMALDLADKPWISYHEFTNTSLKVAWYVGSGGNCTDTAWSCTTVDNDIGGTNDTGWYTSIGFDKNGKAWLSYYDNGNTSLKVAHYVGASGNCTDSAWSCSQVDNNIGGTTTTGYYTSINFDSSSNPWVSYYDISNTSLKVAQYVGSSGSCTDTLWNCTTVDNNISTTTDTGQYTSLAFDSNGNAWISYYENFQTSCNDSPTTECSLKVARYVGSSGNCTSSAWNCSTIDNPTSTNNLGQYTSIDVDKSGTPWVSYYDTTSSSLKITKLHYPQYYNNLRYLLDRGDSSSPPAETCDATSNREGYCGLISDNGEYDSISTVAATEYPIYNFTTKNSNANNTDELTATWIGQSTVAASTQSLKLEVYNFTTKAWETKTTTSSGCSGSDCTVSANITTSLSSYYLLVGSDYYTYWRLYQGAASETLSTDSFAMTFTTPGGGGPTLDQLMRHGKYFNGSGEQPFTF